MKKVEAIQFLYAAKDKDLVSAKGMKNEIFVDYLEQLIEHLVHTQYLYSHLLEEVLQRLKNCHLARQLLST